MEWWRLSQLAKYQLKQLTKEQLEKKSGLKEIQIHDLCNTGAEVQRSRVRISFKPQFF